VPHPCALVFTALFAVGALCFWGIASWIHNEEYPNEVRARLARYRENPTFVYPSAAWLSDSETVARNDGLAYFGYRVASVLAGLAIFFMAAAVINW